jgi:heavy metal translocating P-type ATPase
MASERDPNAWELRAAISWPLALAVLAVGLFAPETAISGWTILTLSVVVELAGGWPFLWTTVKLLRHGATNMDTLISIGTLAALAVSAVEAVALGGLHVHLVGKGAFAERLHGAMAPLIISILVTGRAVEARARRRASRAMHSLLGLRPPVARVVSDVEDEEGCLVPPESVPIGALVRIRPNEAIPLDGVVEKGWSAVDESMLTGEPLPVDRGPGAQVTGGTWNGAGALVVKVSSIAAESVLSRMQRLVEDAQRDKPPLQQLGDRISGIFVPAVLLVAAGTFVAWWIYGRSLGTAVLSAVAVLLVACPCAMGLATPVAMMVGTGRASSLGILVSSADALERLAKVDTVVFDKTGTLTERFATVTGVTPCPDVTGERVLALASAVEAEADHPIALAIRKAAEPIARAADVEIVLGTGVVGTVDGHRVMVGRLNDENIPEPLRSHILAYEGRGETVVAVHCDERIVGVIAVSTPLRPDATKAVRTLQWMGLRTGVLSGDAAPAVNAVAAALNIADARSALSPQEKLDALRSLQTQGRRVMMVGDGVNDAPALAAANVGCSIGSASEAALANSDIALLGSDLQGVPAAIGVAGSTSAVILQNFGWAMGYNLSALPLAAAGLLDPLVAAVAMGASSLIVVLNSLRLLHLGRSGIDRIRTPTVMRGARGFVLSVAVPVLLFGGTIVVGQRFSPSRDQPLLPTLPGISEVSLGNGVEAEVYLYSSQAGPNQFHMVFTKSGQLLPLTATPSVVASNSEGNTLSLPLIRIAPGHYISYPNFEAGNWRITVSATIDGSTHSFALNRTMS